MRGGPKGGRLGGRADRLGGGRQGYLYAAPARAEAEASNDVIKGSILVCHQPAFALFDPGSTYSYMSVYFASHLGISFELLEVPLRVLTPVGDSLVVDQVYRSCVVTIQGRDTQVDLIS